MTIIPHPKRTLGLLILFGLLFLTYCYLETRWIKITEIEIKSVDLPTSFDGSKIVFISDIHLGPYLSANRLSRIVNRINDIKADIILLGGDYVHYRARYIEPAIRELGKLRAECGVYGVLGNHDFYASANYTKKMMEKYEIKSINNQSVWVKKGNDSIKIGGVGDLWRDTQMPEKTLQGLKQSDFAILVSHHPDYIEHLNTNLIDLTLSGHTHGGQITFFGWWAPFIPSNYGQKFRYGLIESERMKSYITSGIGTGTLPLRFFCRPEIVVIRLKKVDQK